MRPDRAPEPWHSFFVELDGFLDEPVELHCAGGFVMSMLYGMPRPTIDVDFFSAVPQGKIETLEAVAGKGSSLHHKYHVHLQFVGVVTVPENYPDRLVEMFPASHQRLRLFGLEAHDLALSKLERNAARDREDVKYLARAVPLNADLLESRYRTELRPYLANRERHDLTMRLWLEAFLGGSDL